MSPCNVTFFGQIDAATDDMCNFANYHAIMFVAFGIMLAVSLFMTAMLYVCNGCTVTDSVERCAKITVLYLFLVFGLEPVLVFAYVVVMVLFVCVPMRDCFPRMDVPAPAVGVIQVIVETEPVANTPIIIETAPPPAVIDTGSIVLDIVAELPAEEEDASTECTICLIPVGSSDRLKTNCCHEFHLTCIAKWLQTNNTCPNCRAPLDP
jgi:hypothetical protein